MRKLLLVGFIVCLAGLPATVLAAGKAFQHWTTSNGVGVYFYPSTTLPMLDVRIVYAAGSARDGDQLGVAAMTSGLMGSGAGGMDANALATEFERVGAQFDAGALRDMAWVTLRTLTLDGMLDPAIDALATVLGKPDFPEDELELVRQQLLTGLQNAEQDPADIAEKAFYKAVYSDHPYGRSAEREDIQALSRAQVEGFFRQYYVSGNARLSLVGNLDRAAAEALAERIVQHMPSGDPAPALPAVAPLKEAKTIRIAHPSEQSHILVGQPGVARGAPEHFALYIANHGFGGSGFASTLMTEVRVKRGLVYSVYSYFSPMQRKGPFIIGLQTRNDQVEEALGVVHDNLTAFIKHGPTEEAYDASIRNITGGSALRSDTNAKLAQYASLIGFYDLPLDYLDLFNDRITQVSREQTYEAFKATVDVNKLVTVIVGGESR